MEKFIEKYWYWIVIVVIIYYYSKIKIEVDTDFEKRKFKKRIDGDKRARTAANRVMSKFGYSDFEPTYEKGQGPDTANNMFDNSAHIGDVDPDYLAQLQKKKIAIDYQYNYDGDNYDYEQTPETENENY